MIEKCFKANLALLSVLRLYPEEKHSYLHKIQGIFMYFVCVVLASLLILIKLITHREEFDDLQFNYNVAYVSESVSWIFKLLPFLIKGNKIRACVQYFAHPRFTVTKPTHVNIVDSCSKICRIMFFIYFGGVLLAVVFFEVTPLFYNDYRFPINMWLPFDATRSLKRYCFIYFLIILINIYIILCGTMVDPLIGGLAYCATGQLKILKDNLKHLNNYVDEEFLNYSYFNIVSSSDSEDFKTDMRYQKVKRCIEHFDNVLNFIKLYEDCFSLTVFSQFAGSLLSVCFCCLQLVNMAEISDMNTLCSIIYIPILVLEIFFYCYFGTVLLEENYTLIDAVCMGDWYNYDPKSKRALITLMERSKKPMILTAGKIIPLTLDTFMTMLKRMYSLLAVMKNF